VQRRIAAIILTAWLAGALPAATLDHAYWAPDRGTPYKWFEGAPALRSHFEKDYRAAGYLYAYLRNGGTQSVSAVEFRLNGTALDDLRKANEVVWWRLLPAQVRPGALGEVTVRLRNPLAAPCELAVKLSDGTEVTARVGPEPNPVRIETVGFAQERDRVFVVLERLDGKARRATTLRLDGKDMSRQSRFLAPAFVGSSAPVVLQLTSPLPLDSAHVYTVTCDDGSQASCCLHTTDGWVPLGSYGYKTYEEYARNGLNSYACFGKLDQGDLEAMARLGLRGASMLGAGSIEPWEVDNRGLYAHYLHDEPDCTDYGFDQLPVPLRIGQMAMEIEKRAADVRRHNPKVPSFLTVDMTYKPANYYIYGPIADVTNADCYPLVIDAEASLVRELAETCRQATGPRPMTFTFQGAMEGPRDPQAFEKMRFPRAVFPAEERAMMLYAIGAGARGLFNYVHSSEYTETRCSRGTGELPEVWNEIGAVYRELELVSPLLALAHPTKLCTSDREQLWLRTLLCGEDAALIVWVNDDYVQDRLRVRVNPQRDVVIRVPEMPWLRGWRAYSVGEAGLAPLERSGPTVRMQHADVGGLILLTATEGLVEQLAQRYEARNQRVAMALLSSWQVDLASRARRTMERRTLAGEYEGHIVTGSGIGAYGMTLPEYWNPSKTRYNVLEAGVNDSQEGPEQGVEWPITVAEPQAGKPHTLHLLVAAFGADGRIVVQDAEGTVLAEMKQSGHWAEGEVCKLRFVPAKAGAYRARITIPGKGPKGVRAAVAAYAVPEP